MFLQTHINTQTNSLSTLGFNTATLKFHGPSQIALPHSNFMAPAKLHCHTLQFHCPTQISLSRPNSTATLKFHGPSQINSLQTRIQHGQFHCGSQILNSTISLSQPNHHQIILFPLPNHHFTAPTIFQFNNFTVPAKFSIQIIWLWQPNSLRFHFLPISQPSPIRTYDNSLESSTQGLSNGVGPIQMRSAVQNAQT